jgi:hypothetical protein
MVSETSLPKALDPPPAIVTAAEPVQPPTTTDVPADAGSGTDVPSSVTVTVTTMDGPDAADAPPPSVPRDTAAQSPAEQEGEGQNPATLAGTGPERLLIQRPESSRSNPRLSRLNILRRRRPKSMRQPRRRCGLSGSRLGRLIGCRGKYQTQVQTPEAPDSEALEDASDAAAGGDHAALSLDDRTAPIVRIASEMTEPRRSRICQSTRQTWIWRLPGLKGLLRKRSQRPATRLLNPESSTWVTGKPLFKYQQTRNLFPWKPKMLKALFRSPLRASRWQTKIFISLLKRTQIAIT